MSELQIGLVGLGIFVVLAIYGNNWNQQRIYRRRFGIPTEPPHEDVLYRSHSEQQAEQELASEELTQSKDELLCAPVTDDICGLLDNATDYVAMLTFASPAGADALALLWQKRFDFGKSVYVCGLNGTTGTWEKVIQESHLFYAAFKLTLQLADRSGPVSALRLNDFRDMAHDIATKLKAQLELAEVAEVSARAQQLDAFCVEVDQMIGLNLLPGGERTFSGGEIARLAELHGMALQADGAFHLPDVYGHTVFSMINHEDEPFQRHTMARTWVTGLTLLLDVPRVGQPAQRFDEMAVLARHLATGLHATVADDFRSPLRDDGFVLIRERIASIESRMVSGNMTPGSAQARRLFS